LKEISVIAKYFFLFTKYLLKTFLDSILSFTSLFLSALCKEVSFILFWSQRSKNGEQRLKITLEVEMNCKFSFKVVIKEILTHFLMIHFMESVHTVNYLHK